MAFDRTAGTAGATEPAVAPPLVVEVAAGSGVAEVALAVGSGAAATGAAAASGAGARAGPAVAQPATSAARTTPSPAAPLSTSKVGNRRAIV